METRSVGIMFGSVFAGKTIDGIFYTPDQKPAVLAYATYVDPEMRAAVELSLREEEERIERESMMFAADQEQKRIQQNYQESLRALDAPIRCDMEDDSAAEEEKIEARLREMYENRYIDEVIEDPWADSSWMSESETLVPKSSDFENDKVNSDSEDSELDV